MSDDRLAIARQLFPQADRWFRIVDDQSFTHLGDGSWLPRHETLTHPRVRWQDGAGHRVLPIFPGRFRGAIHVASTVSPDVWVELTPLDAADVEGHVDDGLLVYPGAFRYTDVVFKSTPTHLDEYLVVWARAAPMRWRYRVTLGPAIHALREVGGTIEARDANDTPWLRAGIPIATDTSGRRVEGNLALEGDELVVSIDTRALSLPILVDPDWRSTGDMAEGRFHHRATVLLDGRMLVTGGCSSSVCSGDLTLPACRNLVRSAEALDPETRTFARVGTDVAGRSLHVAERLGDGRVLVAGGCALSDCSAVNATAALFDPIAGAFREIAAPPDVAAGMVAAPLPDGRLLVAGGCIGSDCTTSAAAFDPETESWSALTPSDLARSRATVTVLRDGRVLVAGGCSDIGCSEVLDAAEVYDPARDAWDRAGSMAVSRAGHFAASLADGTVLVGGGCADTHCARALRSAESFDPGTMSFAPAGELAQPRFGVEAVALPDGSVMVSQGCAAAGTCDLTNELFDPIVREFTRIESAVTARAFHTLVVSHATEQVIANGGCQPTTCSWWNETYDVSGLHPPSPPGPPPLSTDSGPAVPRDASDSPADVTSRSDSENRQTGSHVPPACACRVVGYSRPASDQLFLVAFVLLAMVVLYLRKRSQS